MLTIFGCKCFQTIKKQISEREGERDVCYTSLDAWLFKTSKSNKKDISRFVVGCKSSPNNQINIDIYISVYMLSMFGRKGFPNNLFTKETHIYICYPCLDAKGPQPIFPQKKDIYFRCLMDAKVFEAIQ